MTQASAHASQLARQLLAHQGLDTRAPEDLAADAEQGCARLRVGLSRWVGSEGYLALIDRALGEARAGHPAIADLECQAGDVQGVAAAVGRHGSAEVREGIVALVTQLIDLLGRLIGEEMAMGLVEQAWVQGARPAASTVRAGPRDE